MDLPSRADLQAIARGVVVTTSKKIDPAQVDTLGSDANIVVGVAAVLGTMIIRQLSYRAAALLLDSSFDEDLDRFAFDRYGVTRKGASPALGTIQIRRPSIAAGAGSVPLGTKVETDQGYEYVTTSVASFGPNDLSSSCDVRATQAGKSTQAGADAFKRFSKPQLLWDATLVPSNEEATAGGEEVEDDELLKERVRNYWRTQRRGILDAIEQGSLEVPGVVSAMAVEALTTGALPARVVNLYIADSTGVASRALAAKVAASLNEWRAGGIAVIIHTSLPTLVDIRLALRFVAGVDTNALTTLIRASVLEFVNALPVNGTLYTSELRGVLLRFKPQGLLPDEGTIVTPAGDLVPDVGQTLRITLDRITVTS